ncbi:MAG: glycosyltransferase family 2 protein [Terracidiphilus sp.]
MPSGKFALTYTVKNEARLLPSAIEYHLAAGCSRIYLFWDNTTDNSAELVQKYPQVIARNSFRPEELHNPPSWLSRIMPAWGADLNVRKITNTFYSARDAAKDGIEWLVGIDPDELILMSRREQVLENHIPRYLEKIHDDIDQLQLPNLESVPTAAETENPFTDCVYFLNRFPATEAVWRYSRAALARITAFSKARVTRFPKLIAWYDWLFYEVRFAGALHRMMREPGTKRRIPGTYFLGYSSYKSFIRTDRVADFQFATHGWKPFTRRPRSLRTGNVLHFDLLDAAYFALKFRQRPAPRDIFYLRYMLGLVARDHSLEEIREFFETYIAIRDPKRIELLKKKGILIEIRSASNLLKKLLKTPAPIEA